MQNKVDGRLLLQLSDSDILEGCVATYDSTNINSITRYGICTPSVRQKISKVFPNSVLLQRKFKIHLGGAVSSARRPYQPRTPLRTFFTTKNARRNTQRAKLTVTAMAHRPRCRHRRARIVTVIYTSHVLARAHTKARVHADARAHLYRHVCVRTQLGVNLLSCVHLLRVCTSPRSTCAWQCLHVSTRRFKK